MKNSANTKGTTIWVTNSEYALICESKEFFSRFIGVRKMSFGAYLTILALGSTAMGALSGVRLRCSDCGHETEMTLHRPHKTKVAMAVTHQSQRTE